MGGVVLACLRQGALTLAALVLAACSVPDYVSGGPSECGDGLRNGSETDIDCGGEVCPACEVDRACTAQRDCVDGVCTNGTCRPSSCTDMVSNGTETDVDCGGDCAPCPDGALCALPSDCRERVCTEQRCQPASCADDFQNGGETGWDPLESTCRHASLSIL